MSGRFEVAVADLVINAKYEGAGAFYRHLGFEPLVQFSLQLMLPLDRNKGYSLD